tara:strand:- start:1261 stop:1416 length:156 start_codon:yes stop_codon:yes gene_type:complete
MQEIGFIIGAAAIALLIGYGIRSLQGWRKNRLAKHEAAAAPAEFGSVTKKG